MADAGVKSGDKVLFIWSLPSAPDALRQYAEDLAAITGANGRVSVENMDRLLLCELPFASSSSLFPNRPLSGFFNLCSLLSSASHSASSFDLVLSCLLADSCSIHSPDTLEELARLLKPGGRLLLDEPVAGEKE